MSASRAALIDKLLQLHEQVPTVSGTATYCKECGYTLGDTGLCRTTAAIKNMDPSEALTAIQKLHPLGLSNDEMCPGCGWCYGGWCPTRRLIEV
jgi:hypothetical protein